MALTVLGLLIVAGVVVKVMTGEERARTFQNVIEFLKELKHAARRRPDEQVFHDTLNERSRWAFVTLTLVVLNAVIFLFMLLGPGSLSDPQTLVDWGGSIGPRTTNGEWWRVATSMFVHHGLFQLVVFAGALFQVGWLLERLVGRSMFAAAYFTAGLLAALVNLSAHRATVGFGASGAVSGIYGLLLAFVIWCRFRPGTVTIPRTTLKRFVPVTVLFVLYGLAGDRSLSGAAELTGLLVGFIGGLVSLIGTSDLRPSPRRIAAVSATGVVLAVLGAIPLRGIADIRPELERIVAFEDQSAGTYAAADGKFKKRLITADALATLIDQSIVAGLEASQARLRAIRKVPKEHGAMLADATEYLRLRSESWRLRAEGLRHIELRTLQASRDTEPAAASWRRRAETQHRANLAMMGNADGKARAALVVLDRIRTTRT